MGHSASREPALAAPIIQFEDVQIDLGKFEVRRGGRRVHLEKQPFDLLILLLRNRGELVPRKQIAESLWSPDVFVETDRSINNAIRKIRLALGDDPERPRFIETVAGRGYRFIAIVSSNSGSQLESVSEHIVSRKGHDTLATNDPTVLAISVSNPESAAVNQRLPIVNAAKWLVLGTVALVLLPAAIWELRQKSDQGTERAERRELAYAQITNFTDSAVAPTLSPDGQMVAFYRSDSDFLTPDQIYVKWLSKGEPAQLTNDPTLKYGLAFSPDGSRIAYTTYDAETDEWKTFTVSPLGGEPTLLLSNAAGLSWLDQRQVLFSEIESGAHMGIVTATENRSEYRKLYFPQHQRMMAHFSHPSPDRKWALVAEMDPVWQPCRLISLHDSETRQVGPQGRCTSAAWSPDGKWMYFGAEVEGSHHLWLQRFAGGQPEQMTFGPTEEDGLAVSPDGRSIVTSIGLHESALWMHDKHGDRALSSEGYVNPSSARFSSDGKLLFYLVRRDASSSSSGLWRRDLASGKSQAVLPAISMVEYDVSSDAKEVVYSTQPAGKASQLWLAHLDGSVPPTLIASGGVRVPRFGPDAQVVFQFTDGKANYIGQVKEDGSELSRLLPYPISAFLAISPDRRWIVADVPLPNDDSIRAIPIKGGSSRRVCTWCSVDWAPDGKFFYIGFAPNSRTTRSKTLAIPVPAGETFPKLPSSGIRELEDAKVIPGTRVLDGWFISPGPEPSVFAYVKTTVHRNLYRIPVP
jgi:Tol biopolymer transport system component/DNA-binding winged helix-turn-helix (wHTH) protein